MLLIHCGKHFSAYGIVQLFSLLPNDSTGNSYPVPKTGEELAVFARGGIQVSMKDEIDVEVNVYLGNDQLDNSWFFIQSGEILVGSHGFIEVGNFIDIMTKVPVESGKYKASVYTNTGDLYNATKVAFVLEKLA